MEDSTNIYNWKKVIKYLDERLETRHFRPIDKILRMRITTGEGFAVMILVCSLIEYLQSCYEGRTFKFRAEGTKFIYGDSAREFKNFLIQHEPFKAFFQSPFQNLLEV